MTSTPLDAAALATAPEASDSGAPPAAADPEMARTDPRHGKARRRYKIRGPETWALIRESYLAGAPARELALRYDVTEWAIWRRAWKGGWTKLDRVEAAPPPALEPVTPDMTTGGEDGDPDPRNLIRQALRGVASALRQNRLAEARNLSQIAASLERLGEGGKSGGFTLGDLVRFLYDVDFRRETMAMDPDGPNPPEKSEYWDHYRRERNANGQAIAALRSCGYAEGRAKLRTELGLEPEPKGPDHWVWHSGGLCEHDVLERKRQQEKDWVGGRNE